MRLMSRRLSRTARRSADAIFWTKMLPQGREGVEETGGWRQNEDYSLTRRGCLSNGAQSGTRDRAEACERLWECDYDRGQRSRMCHRQKVCVSALLPEGACVWRVLNLCSATWWSCRSPDTHFKKNMHRNVLGGCFCSWGKNFLSVLSPQGHRPGCRAPEK